MQELRENIEGQLRDKQYRTSLNNLTDDLLSLKISDRGNRNTVLTIKRHRHRPFEIEVVVDHTLIKDQDLITRRKRVSTGGNRSFFGSYRLLWIGLIFMGLILTIFNIFISIFLDILNAITPGWSPTQQALGIIGLVVLIGSFWIIIAPLIGRKRTEAMKAYDKSVLENVCKLLGDLREETSENAIKRCWSCFQEIAKTERFCPNCGKEQG